MKAPGQVFVETRARLEQRRPAHLADRADQLRIGVRPGRDNLNPDPTLQRLEERLLKAGARFYEYQPARFHCKYLLVDDCWASVGSANLDNRSLSLNEEANLNVLNRDFVAAHAALFEEDKNRSREITLHDWRNRPFKEKIKGRLGSVLRAQM